MEPSLRNAFSFSRLWKITTEHAKTILLAATLFTAMSLASAGPLWSQAATSLRGVVNDPSGGAVSGATVTLTNTESKIERKIATSEEGWYQFSLLPPGTYTLTVSATGFQSYERAGLTLLVNTPATVNAELKIGSASEIVH